MSARKAFEKVYDYITECVFEREEQTLLMLAAVLSKQHVFLIGPPGTGKSMMIRKMLNCFPDDVEYFNLLLMKESTREEAFGMVDVKALKGGDYKFKVDKFLPTAHFAFMDEIWKANSGILNGLLTATNERKFKNGTEEIDIPLQTMFTASNELPADNSLQALYDRMLVRMEVPPLLKKSSKMKMIDRRDGVDVEPDAPKVLDLATLEKAREESGKVVFDDAAKERWVELQQKVHREMAGTCYVSDRRWDMAYQGLKRIVWLNGGDKITKDDFIYLTNMLWEDPSQRSQIASILSSFMGVLTNRAQELYNRIEQNYDELLKGDVSGDELPDIYAAAKEAKRELDDESSDSPVFEMYVDKFNSLFAEIRDQYIAEMGF